jgi:hypothetical protein
VGGAGDDWRLVEGFGDDGVGEEDFEGDDFESGFVSGFEYDGAGCPGALDLEPAGSTDAPAVSGLEAGEAVLRHGCGEIVAEAGRGGEEFFVHDAANGVEALVVRAGVAAAVAEEARHGLAAAGFKSLAEDVFLGLEGGGVHLVIVVGGWREGVESKE